MSVLIANVDGMNDLQHLNEREHGPVLVTLNPPFEPSKDLTIGRYKYDHPLLDALGYESLTITEDYLSGTGSIDYESDESYVEGSAGKIAHTANHNWRHDFQEIVGSLLAAGLSIEAFRESPHAEWKALPFLVETEQGWTMPEGMPKIPLSFAIVARKLQE